MGLAVCMFRLTTCQTTAIDGYFLRWPLKVFLVRMQPNNIVGAERTSSPLQSRVLDLEQQ